ncbi:MAG: DUF2075 domain-containing protein [Hyphomonadaceae bacterium]|nr:DUF2075 domain-containing protein [Hyphomonadaceae bacterium]
MLQVAYYQASIETFNLASPESILGDLAHNNRFSLEGTQRDAWVSQVKFLQIELANQKSGEIFFEFSIPRMGKRADVVILIGGIVFVVEFKVGSKTFDTASIRQVHDYALDLKNFHRGSHDLPIVPVLIATRAEKVDPPQLEWAADNVATPLRAQSEGLLAIIKTVLAQVDTKCLDPHAWARSGYLPTPTIVEAAQALYQNHSVEEIARSDAGAKNLNATTQCLRDIIRVAHSQKQKTICFVTGVPGSGKTLAGLNMATETANRPVGETAVFLSGNGPLVDVLREALARDQKERTGCTKIDARREVSSFVQNIHHFRDEALKDPKAPPEHIVIFDEAQRAWDQHQASKFMQSKRGQKDFNKSEPEFLIEVMDRHEDWSVVICLVGGGQEINTGEAGLSEWMRALEGRFSDWKVYLSDRLLDPHYGLETSALSLNADTRIQWQSELHLGVSMRSFRAEALSGLVRAILDNQATEASRLFETIKEQYPTTLTRNLETARTWLREQARGNERFGFMASSGAYRLRPEGLNVRVSVDAVNWFLNGPDDVRSAYYLEEVATEFDVQGLEVDWAGICWDADLRYADGEWDKLAFRGTKWQRVNKKERQTYLINAYRVILTRARQGLVIYVPKGDSEDPTRLPDYYDQTAEFLESCGIPRLD